MDTQSQMHRTLQRWAFHGKAIIVCKHQRMWSAAKSFERSVCKIKKYLRYHLNDLLHDLLHDLLYNLFYINYSLSVNNLRPLPRSLDFCTIFLRTSSNFNLLSKEIKTEVSEIFEFFWKLPTHTQTQRCMWTIYLHEYRCRYAAVPVETLEAEDLDLVETFFILRFWFSPVVFNLFTSEYFPNHAY